MASSILVNQISLKKHMNQYEEKMKMSKWEKILISYLIAFVIMALIVLIVYFDFFPILAYILLYVLSITLIAGFVYWALFNH